MAKLGIYYGLCPLIDQKSLLGVSDDATEGCVIVTLGKNMAIKYKLSDQKQLHSWSTKEKLSSPVVYDKKSDRYVAIFNQNYLRLWSPDENNLDKVKKIKFPANLHTIILEKEEPILIYKNGYGYTLSYALENKKSIFDKSVIDRDSTIESSVCLYFNEKTYICSMIKTNKGYKFVRTVPNETNEESMIEIERDNFTLIGHVAMDTDNGPTLFTLWSDGRLFIYPLFSRGETQPPGNFYAVVESLSRCHEVCMSAVSNNYIALYGADTNQEGASLQLYNIQFKVTQSRLQFKMFSEGSKLWTIGNSLLLTVGQNLAVIPYKLATEQLAALVGSHKLVATADDDDLAIVTEVLVGHWEENGEIMETNGLNINSKLKSEITSLVNEGWSESAICEHIIPKLIEKKDVDSIVDCINYFMDIPDVMLVKLISFCLLLNSSNIKNKDILNEGLPKSCTKLLDKLLSISYNDSILMPYLRTNLKFDDVLILLQYLCFILRNSDSILPGLSVIDSESKIIDWGCLLIDSHYQQLLLLKDKKITDILNQFKEIIDKYYLCLEDYKQLEPLVTRLKRGKCEAKMNRIDKYSIERIQLY